MAVSDFPALGKVPSGADPEMRRLLSAMKETIEALTGRNPRGNIRNQALTVGEMETAGMVAVSRKGEVTPTASGETLPEMTIPPAPSGLTATAGVNYILLQWDQVTYGNHAHAVIYRGAADDFGQALEISTSSGTMFPDPVSPGATYYYWVKFFSDSNNSGSIAGPVFAQTASGNQEIAGTALVEGALSSLFRMVDGRLFLNASLMLGHMSADSLEVVGNGSEFCTLSGHNTREDCETAGGRWVKSGLSAFSANLGHVTAGRIESAVTGGKQTVIDLDNGTFQIGATGNSGIKVTDDGIRIYDDGGNLRVIIGNLGAS